MKKILTSTLFFLISTTAVSGEGEGTGFEPSQPENTQQLTYCIMQQTENITIQLHNSTDCHALSVW